MNKKDTISFIADTAGRSKTDTASIFEALDMEIDKIKDGTSLKIGKHKIMRNDGVLKIT